MKDRDSNYNVTHVIQRDTFLPMTHHDDRDARSSSRSDSRGSDSRGRDRKERVLHTRISEDLAEDIRRVAEGLSYRGGGKPHMAQFGIPNASDFSKVEEFVKVALEDLL